MLTNPGHSQSTRSPAFDLFKKDPEQLQELGLNLGKQSRSITMSPSHCRCVMVNAGLVQVMALYGEKLSRHFLEVNADFKTLGSIFCTLVIHLQCIVGYYRLLLGLLTTV